MSKQDSPFTPKVCSCCGAPLDEDNICTYCGVSHYGPKRQITALDSYRQIMSVMNRHRLIVEDDFVDETFIPDL